MRTRLEKSILKTSSGKWKVLFCLEFHGREFPWFPFQSLAIKKESAKETDYTWESSWFIFHGIILLD